MFYYNNFLYYIVVDYNCYYNLQCDYLSDFNDFFYI